MLYPLFGNVCHLDPPQKHQNVTYHNRPIYKINFFLIFKLDCYIL
jgi:hypothetical protein